MPRVKEVRHCELCAAPFYRSNGNVDAKYCSVLCACRARNTRKHQQKAGRVGGAVKISKARGTGIKNTYVKFYGRHEHRVVAERMLGRKLKRGEVVHHKDNNKKNNDPRNLIIFKNQAEHARHHMELKYGRAF